MCYNTVMEQRINFTLQWSATILTIAGAIFTSLNMYPQNVVAFNLGGTLWLLYASRINHKSLIVTNAGLLMIYILGLVKAVV